LAGTDRGDLIVRQWTVDAFASGPFKGNPACVVEPFEAWPEDAWMQALAQENNQAETAFLRRTGEAGVLELRWFTPGMEVPLCGHATLAAGHVLAAELGQGGPFRFATRNAGELIVHARGDAYEMDFPSDPPARIDTPEGLESAVGTPIREVWAGLYLAAVVDDEATVRRINPDIAAIHRIGAQARGGRGNLIVCAAAEAASPYDVVSRFFGPGSGVPEDPTTGSAHCILAPLFTEKLQQNPLRFHQAFPGRGGDLECEVKGDRVLLRGRAVTVVESTLRL
jgi:PhzF family phenazine biosynthesis protein